MKKTLISIAVATLCLCATSCKSNVDKAYDLTQEALAAMAAGDFEKAEELGKKIDAIELTEAEEQELEKKLAGDLGKINEAVGQAVDKASSDLQESVEDVQDALKELQDAL